MVDRLYVARWLDTATADCVHDDGLDGIWDMVLLPNIMFALTPENALRLITDELISDELIDSFNATGNEFIPPPKEDFAWLQDSAVACKDGSEAWNCYWNGDVVACAVITRMERRQDA
jgi:hypothetical protein